MAGAAGTAVQQHSFDWVILERGALKMTLGWGKARNYSEYCRMEEWLWGTLCAFLGRYKRLGYVDCIFWWAHSPWNKLPACANLASLTPTTLSQWCHAYTALYSCFGQYTFTAHSEYCTLWPSLEMYNCIIIIIVWECRFCKLYSLEVIFKLVLYRNV